MSIRPAFRFDNAHWLHTASQRGQSAVEFLVVFPALCLLVFGIIQFSLIYQARSVLNHATLLAARAGAFENGSQNAMRRGLASGLVALYASEASASGYAAALAKATLETSSMSNLVKIAVLTPNKAAFEDFGQAKIAAGGGREIPNDTLNYRNPTPGGKSKISVQDANLLHVRVTYCYRLIVPIMDRIIHAVANAKTSFHVGLNSNGMSNPFGTGGEPSPLTDPCFSPLASGPRIPIMSEAIVRMQTPFYESNL